MEYLFIYFFCLWIVEPPTFQNGTYIILNSSISEKLYD